MDNKKRQKNKAMIDRWINGQKREQGDRKRGPKASGGKKGRGVKITYFNNPLKGHVYNRKLTIYWANQKVRGKSIFA